MTIKEEVHLAETECLKSKEYPKVVVIGRAKGERWYSVSINLVFFVTNKSGQWSGFCDSKGFRNH